MQGVYGIKPFHFVHILDLNSNVTRVEVGPLTIALKTNESVVAGPHPMVIVPPGHYCVILNPCCDHSSEGKLCKLKHGFRDIRFFKEPFPLCPGEILDGAESFLVSGDHKAAIKALPVIGSSSALILEAEVDHKDGDVQRRSGELWQIEGPCTYKPTCHAIMKGMKQAEILKPGQALRLRAEQELIDRSDKRRVTDEEWLVTTAGAYLTGVYEAVVGIEEAWTLTPDVALHLRASERVTDSIGVDRFPGEEWIVTRADTEMLYPTIGIEVVANVKRTVLRRNQFCVLLNPVDQNGRPQLGKRKVIEGIATFFLHPGEHLENGIQVAYILTNAEALVLQCLEAFSNETERRSPGERWMIRGPRQYVPTKFIKVVEKREEISLADNQGIYVRNVKSGLVRSVMGPQSYILTENEVFFEKELSKNVEEMLKRGGGMGAEDIRKIAYFKQCIDPTILKGRDKTRVVTYRCPHNTACQVYDFAKKKARVTFGPDLVILGPNENFNVLSLSAGKPKKTNALMSLALMLGPDFITDIITVETSDHARLQIKLAFNNRFEYDPNDDKSAAKLFNVPDFIGFAAQQVASHIRAAVARISFDEFHRHSSKIIQSAVFGQKSELKFSANNLVISNIDIQSIEPVDLKMRDSLMKSVQMAIEISTNSIEATATHEATRLAQVAYGNLERQKISNEKEAEKERGHLLQLQALSAAVESTGQAVAEAQAKAQRMKIEGISRIEGAKLKAKAADIMHSVELNNLSLLRSSELDFEKMMHELNFERAHQMSDIEVSKFSAMIKAIGADTLKSIATAGPDMQAKLLSSLGLESVLLTDGNSPVNLFNTAKGLVSEN